MRRLSRSVLVVLAAVVAQLAVAGAGTPAFAFFSEGDVIVANGAGTVSPGLGVTPATEHYLMNATAKAFGTEGGGHTCTFTADSLAPETIALGVGRLSGSCGAALPFPSCVYVRAATLMTVACVFLGGNLTELVAGGELVLVPGQLPPATVVSYTFEGVLTLAAVGCGTTACTST